MPVKIRAVERANPSDRSKKKYYPYVIKTGDIQLEELADIISEATTLTRTDVKAVLDALLVRLKFGLKDGYTFKLKDFGIFTLGVTGKGKNTKKEVDSKSVIKARIRFLPGKELREAMKLLEFVKTK